MLIAEVTMSTPWFFVVLGCFTLLGYIIGTTRDTRDGSPDD